MHNIKDKMSHTVIYGSDGSDLLVCSVDASGLLNVNVSSSALPSGISTEAKQDTLNTKIGDIDTGINKARATGTIYENATVSNEDLGGIISMGDGKDRYSSIQLMGDSPSNLFSFVIIYSIDGIDFFTDGVANTNTTNATTSRYDFSVSRININASHIQVKIIVGAGSVNMYYSLSK
jgi:hypothetical protein